jgi:hypothetical protein
MLAGAVWKFKPGDRSWLLAARCALILEHQCSFGITITEASEAVGDKAESLHPLEKWIPSIRLVAVHMLEEVIGVIFLQDVFNLTG